MTAEQEIALESYKDTGLWRRSLGHDSGSIHDGAYNHLRAAFSVFRERAAVLTNQIAKALPNLTIHDVTHLDALWETADLIAGQNYPLNPAEAFVLGGAILLHDSALCFEAYTGGQTGLRETVEWKDAFSSIKARGGDALLNEQMDEADFAAMRLLHASQASDLALQSWTTPEGEALHLIESHELRKHYGRLIGEIASSHHWSIEDVESKLQKQLNAPASLPRDWRIDPIKIACLLRCADAAHLDSRRAPDFLRALSTLHGISAQHWTAQNWLERADRDTAAPDEDAIIFTSGRPFDETNADAWWVAFDAICLVDRELSSSSKLLKHRPQSAISPPFQMRRVTGAGSPSVASQTIKTAGWEPHPVEIHVGNLERLISQLGGENLYGGEQPLLIVLRELIQNARDAVAARSELDPSYKGRICVRHKTDGDRHSLLIEDDGIGMSERVITSPLLDFGASFWASDLAQHEFRGLASSLFRSVGKFGIGFYSIFMAASSASITSRRYDAAYKDAIQVKFPNGLTLRPLITRGAPSGFSQGTKTRVEFLLKPEFGSPDSILIKKERPGYEIETRMPLGQCIAILAAGLDVPVDVVDKNGNLSTVHLPLSDLDTKEKRRAWLTDLCGPARTSFVPQVFDSHADRLRPIIKDGRTLGLAALSTFRVTTQDSLGTVMTVGGLANGITKSDLSRFVGVIDYEPNSAKREPSPETTAGREALDIWAEEQKTLLPDRIFNPIDWYFATLSLADLGIDPIDIATIAIMEGSGFSVKTLNQTIDLICTKGLAFYQSPMMKHVDLYHSQIIYKGIPTFWPITHGSFLSLERDLAGNAPITSALSCIERGAKARGLKISSQYAPQPVPGHFGLMPVLLLSARSLE